MFIAHLPAGYLVSRWMARGQPRRKALIVTGLVASVLPDADLFWFYLVDARQTLHHAYVFHWPLFWLALAGLGWGMARLLHRPDLLPFLKVALACLLLHMALDSVAAEIGWLRPFSDRELHLVEVPAGQSWWVMNFVLHWTFAVELAITLFAALVLIRDLRTRATL